eukprot:6977486-Alexandrium_andersonii.AAC.1
MPHSDRQQGSTCIGPAPRFALPRQRAWLMASRPASEWLWGAEPSRNGPVSRAAPAMGTASQLPGAASGPG